MLLFTTLCIITSLLLVSNTRDKMTFHWTGPNAIEDGEETGSMALSPVLKRHNAYLVHNETVYCNHEDEWRGEHRCPGLAHTIPWLCRRLQLPEGEAPLHTRQGILLDNSLHSW